MLIMIASTTFLMGLFGYLVAGKMGLGNSLVLGLVLGLVGSFTLGAFIIFARFWGDYSGRYGEWYIKRWTEGDDEKQREEEKKRR